MTTISITSEIKNVFDAYMSLLAPDRTKEAEATRILSKYLLQMPTVKYLTNAEFQEYLNISDREFGSIVSTYHTLGVIYHNGLLWYKERDKDTKPKRGGFYWYAKPVC